MRNFSVILFLILFLISQSCKDHHPFEKVYSIWLKNNDKKAVVFLLSYNYPDTTVPFINEDYVIVASGLEVPFDKKEKWEKIFTELPKDTLSIFIFDHDVYVTDDWQTIREEYKILTRYDVSLEYLQQNNWTIIYP